MEDGVKWLKRILFAALLVFVIADTIFIANAYVKSEWWNTEQYLSQGIHIDPAGNQNGARKLFRFIRDNTPIDAVLINPLDPSRIAVFSERPVLSGYHHWVSLGQPGEEDRKKMLKRIFSAKPFESQDLHILTGLKRSVYVLFTPTLSRSKALVEKYDRRRDLFKLVYNNDGLRLYKFTGSQ